MAVPASFASDLPPHHRAGGGFRNPWPSAQGGEGRADVLKWMMERWRTARPPVRAESIPRTPPRLADSESLQGEIESTWLGHSTALVRTAGLTVLTDPVWAHRVSPVRFAGPTRWVPAQLAIDALPPVDVVLQSHDHYDHFDVAATRRLALRNPGATWCVPLGMATMVRRCGVKRVVELDWWQEASIGTGSRSCGVRAVPAQHFSGRGLTGRDSTLWCGWAIDMQPGRVYYAGDSGYHPEFARIGEVAGPFDLTIIPIGAYEPRWFMSRVHMDPDEAVMAWGEIARAQQGVHGRAPAPLLGVHWGTYRLTDEPMDEPPRRAKRFWNAQGLPPDRLWTLAHGESRRCAITR